MRVSWHGMMSVFASSMSWVIVRWSCLTSAPQPRPTAAVELKNRVIVCEEWIESWQKPLSVFHLPSPASLLTTVTITTKK